MGAAEKTPSSLLPGYRKSAVLRSDVLRAPAIALDTGVCRWWSDKPRAVVSVQCGLSPDLCRGTERQSPALTLRRAGASWSRASDRDAGAARVQPGVRRRQRDVEAPRTGTSGRDLPRWPPRGTRLTLSQAAALPGLTASGTDAHGQHSAPLCHFLPE